MPFSVIIIRTMFHRKSYIPHIIATSEWSTLDVKQVEMLRDTGHNTFEVRTLCS